MVRAYRPESLDEALALLGSREMAVMAGGTDLMVKYRARAGTLPSFKKDVLLVGHLDQLKGISLKGGLLRIGAATSMEDILRSGDIPEYVKGPIRQIGSPAIRNMGTLGGNICNASPAGDSLTMLYALDAILEIASAGTSRSCRIDEFIVGPGRNMLASGEIVKCVIIPIGAFNRYFYRKAGQRRANAIAKVSFYGLVDVADGKPRDVRMALGAVAPVVVRSRRAEELLCAGASARAREELLRSVVPIDDVRSTMDYRRTVAENLINSFFGEVRAD